MYAEQLGPRPVVQQPLLLHSPVIAHHPSLARALANAAPSPAHTPLLHPLGRAPDVVAVRDSMASMALPRLDGPSGLQGPRSAGAPLHALDRRIAGSPAASGGAPLLLAARRAAAACWGGCMLPPPPPWSLRRQLCCALAAEAAVLPNPTTPTAPSPAVARELMFNVG
jgi:hypothetical protein